MVAYLFSLIIWALFLIALICFIWKITRAIVINSEARYLLIVLNDTYYVSKLIISLFEDKGKYELVFIILSLRMYLSNEVHVF